MSLNLHECENEKIINEIFDPRSSHLSCRPLPSSLRGVLGDELQVPGISTFRVGGGLLDLELAADWGRFCSSQQSTAAAAMCVVVAGVRFGLVLLELETRGHTGAAPMGR